MAGRWQDEQYGDEPSRRPIGYGDAEREQVRRSEGRSFGDDYGRYEGEGPDRVFGERESGAGYNIRSPYARRDDEDRYGRGGWQRPDYQGVSPAMQQGEYELERHRRAQPQFQHQDYTRAGRFYGDDGRGRIYGEQYGQGDLEAGHAPRSYGGEPADFLRRSGERISSWFGRAAAEVRHDFDGLRNGADRGHRGRGPQGYVRPDERITDEVHTRLTDDPWVDASQVAVSVSGGEVTLSGTVESREAKHRAERCVEDIPGVCHVQNNLRVDRGGFFTSPSRGFGDSVVEAEMRKGEGEAGAAPGTTARKA